MSHPARGEGLINTVIIVSWPNVIESNPKALFSIATTPGLMREHDSFSWIAPLDTYLIMLCVKQGGIKYNFLSP